MLALMTARFVGNIFNEGIFDMIIHNRHWPVLEEHAKKALTGALSVHHVMIHHPTTLCEVCVLTAILSDCGCQYGCVKMLFMNPW